jgi:Ca-activated chloride channel family protein
MYQTEQCGIERSLFDEQRSLGDLPDAQKNAVTMQRTERDCFQNQKIESSWKKVGLAGRAHSFSGPAFVRHAVPVHRWKSASHLPPVSVISTETMVRQADAHEMLFHLILKLIDFRCEEFSVRLRVTGTRIVLAAFLVILGGWHAGAAGQSNRGSKSGGRNDDEQSLRFNAETTLVLIPATVTDPLNRFVLGLQKQDFHLFEDGTEQTIAHFSGEDAPLSLGLVFDTSGSMGDKLRTSRKAALRFLTTMNAQDEAFLIQFSDRAELAIGFTNQTEEIQTSLRAVQPGGLTAMLDAAEMALRQMKTAKNPRKAILIISDGGDNNSRYTAAEIESLVREADVQVYAMGVFEPSILPRLTKEEVSGPRLLSELAEQTGGRAFTASDPNDLPNVAVRIGIELRNQYLLAYTPKNQKRDGKYRRVEVKVGKLAGVPSLKVHWRLGYYAPSQ